jgi:putative membrane protein (TIGR04086 family)
MLAALNFGAVFLGVAAGGLGASLLSLALSSGLELIGVERGADIGLVVGVVVGLFLGGWVAGSRAVHSHRFHGMVTGLLLAFVVVVIARLGGSPASAPTVLWLAVLAVVVSGLAGFLAGRRRSRDS